MSKDSEVQEFERLKLKAGGETALKRLEEAKQRNTFIRTGI